MEQPVGTDGLIHLFSAALAEFAFVVSVLLYLGNAKGLFVAFDKMRLAAHSDAPTSRPLKKSATRNGFLSAQLAGFGLGRFGAEGMHV